MIWASVNVFPTTPSAKDASRLPWGCVAAPLGVAVGDNYTSSCRDDLDFAETFDAALRVDRMDSGEESRSSSAENDGSCTAPRCLECGAYANSLCARDRWGWSCCLCGARGEEFLNSLSSTLIKRTGAIAVHDFPAADDVGEGDNKYLKPNVVGCIFIVSGKTMSNAGARAALESSAASLLREATALRFAVVGVFENTCALVDFRHSRPHILKFSAVRLGVEASAELICSAMFDCAGKGSTLTQKSCNLNAALHSLSLVRGIKNNDFPASVELVTGCVAALETLRGGQIALIAPVEKKSAFGDVAVRAAHSGITVDAMRASSSFRDKKAEFPLVDISGGVVFDSLDELCGIAASRRAWRLMMRVRTSPQFKVSDEPLRYPLVPCNVHAGVWRMGSCSPSTTVAFGLSFTSSSGFDGAGRLPAVQIAALYWSSDLQERRLRVCTARYQTSSSPSKILLSCSSDVAMRLLWEQAAAMKEEEECCGSSSNAEDDIYENHPISEWAQRLRGAFGDDTRRSDALESLLRGAAAIASLLKRSDARAKIWLAHVHPESFCKAVADAERRAVAQSADVLAQALLPGSGQIEEEN